MVKIGDIVNGFLIMQVDTHFDLSQKRQFVSAKCTNGHIIYRRLTTIRKIRGCVECRKESDDRRAGNRNPDTPQKVYVRTRIQWHGYNKGAVKRWLVMTPAPGDVAYVLEEEDSDDDTTRSCPESMGNVREIHSGNG